MNFIQSLLLFLSGLATALLSVGLYKPWLMLWWRDHQTRRMVIGLYGSTGVVSYMIYLLISLLRT